MEVIKLVEIEKPVEVVKFVEVEKYVDRPVEVIKEVFVEKPIEIIKYIEIEKPIEVIKTVEVEKFIDDEISNARIDIFDSQAEVNEQQLNIERAESQLLGYQSILKESKEVKDLQIILNLTEGKKVTNDKENAKNITKFSGAKYLPIGSRVIAIKSELSDTLEAL